MRNFSGKRIDNGEWVYGYLSFIYVDVPEKAAIYDPETTRQYDVYTNTICQETGLEDKNDIMSSEHDLIKIYMYNGFYSDKWVAEIVYEKGQYGIRYGESYKAFYPLATFFKSTKTEYISNVGEVVVESKPMFEIIGNIYDNPELLKK